MKLTYKRDNILREIEANTALELIRQVRLNDISIEEFDSLTTPIIEITGGPEALRSYVSKRCGEILSKLSNETKTVNTSTQAAEH